jgi:hypothetical protein
MNTKTLLAATAFCLLAPVFTAAQFVTQHFFEAPDTALIIHVDTSVNNVWEIGEPEHILFDTAASVPNVIVTKLTEDYPPNSTSSFEIEVPWGFNGGDYIMAFQWMQKLDFDTVGDGAMIDFTVDGGSTWESIFNNPNVYNFYGFDSTNLHVLPNSQLGFSGTDTAWSNIWVCLNPYYFQIYDFRLRFTLISDSIETLDSLGIGHEGWMMDNFISHTTWIHTTPENEPQKVDISVFPTATDGEINIQIKRLSEPHFIERMELVGMNGQVVKTWENLPDKYWIDISDQATGAYFLRIKTNQLEETESFPIFKR